MNKYVKNIVQELGVKVPDFECPEIGQTPDELLFQLNVVSLLQPKIIIEIGSSTGGHIYLLSTVLNDKNHEIITIDPWIEDSKYGKNYRVYCDCISNLREFNKHIKFNHIRKLSQSSRALEALKNLLKDKKIDFLFIDGSHAEEDVLQDWKNYKDLVADDGLIGFHDVVGYSGAKAAWKKIVKELNPEYSTRVINKPGIPLLKGWNDPVELGIGYIYSRKLPEKVKYLLEDNNS